MVAINPVIILIRTLFLFNVYQNEKRTTENTENNIPATTVMTSNKFENTIANPITRSQKIIIHIFIAFTFC